MRVKDKIKLGDLYFGYKNYAMGYTSGEGRKVVTNNLFGSHRVLRSVAMWVLMSEEERKAHDALSWCFADTRGRCEYEFMMSPWVGGGEPHKVDVWAMYVEPNANLLMDMVNRVTKSSAEKYISDERKRLKRC